MTSPRSSLLRSATVGCVVAAAVCAGTTSASAEPAFGSQFIRTNYLSLDPFPFGYEDLEAATNGTGVVRLSAGELYNLLGPRCAGYSNQLSVRWINFTNGNSGSEVISDEPTTVTTGSGPVGISVSPSGTIGVPGFGLLNP